MACGDTLSKSGLPGYRYLDCFLVIPFLALLYIALRAPFINKGFIFLDDGETLYHALSLFSGKIWYKDDVSHHFLGYVLPFYWTARLGGFSEHILGVVAAMHQIATSWGLYLICRRWGSPMRALGVACLYISAREPFNFGFYQQYQINFFFVFTLLFSLNALTERTNRWLTLSCLSAGTALLFDQRCVFLALIPACAFFQRRPKQLSSIFLPFLAYALPMLSALYWIIDVGAWHDFIDQTWRFPREYRVGSLSLLDALWVGLYAHRHLLSATPILLILGMIGILGLLRRIASTPAKAQLHLLLFAALALLPMPFVGARDFPHYLITYYPFLALCCYFLCEAFEKFKVQLAPILCVAPFITTFVALKDSIALQHDESLSSFVDQGRETVVSELKSRLNPQDTLYVWGYRLDLYVALKKLAAYRMANTLFIQPDSEIKDIQERSKHEDPKYVAEFKENLRGSPPTYVVLFWRERSPLLPSESNTALFDTLSSHYSKILSTSGKDILGAQTNWEIYKRNDSA